MSHKPRSQHRRVSYKVRRCVGGWLPVVLLGEAPMVLRMELTRAEAREVARQRASILRKAGL
jgi:hypothetical protein